MRILPQNPNSPVAGMALVDVLIFMAVFSLVLSLCFAAFSRFDLQSKRLRQNASDIEQTVRAGEMWRADIRGAVGKIHYEDTQSGPILRIPHQHEEITYTFSNHTVSRQRGPGAAVPLLRKVRTSVMQSNKRQFVTSWTWEIELTSMDKQPRVRPLFSFEAVPGGKP